MNILDTQRLIIRPFAMDDLPQAHAVLDHDLEWSGPAFTLADRRERLQMYIALAQWDDTARLYGFRAIILKESTTLIGLCGFHPDVWPPAWQAVFWPPLFGEASHPAGPFASLELGLGYALSPSARGHGYATEAVQALLAYAWQTVRINRVFAVTDRNNAASETVMRRVGMRTARNPDPLTAYPGVVGVIENSR